MTLQEELMDIGKERLTQMKVLLDELQVQMSLGKSEAKAARAQIDAKFKDSEFMSRYNSPNMSQRQSAIAEMEALQKIVAGVA